MSLKASRKLQLERKRMEELRLERRKDECRVLLATCETEISQAREPAVQQIAARGLQQLRRELQQTSAQVEQTPDKALKAVKKAQKQLHKVLANAQAEAHKWSQERAAAQARIEETRARVDAEKQTAKEAGAQVLAQAERVLGEATLLHRQGRYLEAVSKCEQAESLVDTASQATFDETVRREVIRGLLAALQMQSFVVEGPTLRRNDGDAGTVCLVGRLPSGRTARFEVQLEGQVTYDLDGYEGRTCAQQVERIEETLRDRFGIKLGPAQVTWKNPDRISKGARNLPSGTQFGQVR